MKSNAYVCSQYNQTAVNKINNHGILYICVCVYTFHIFYTPKIIMCKCKWVFKSLSAPIPSMKNLRCFTEIKSVKMDI